MPDPRSLQRMTVPQAGCRHRRAHGRRLAAVLLLGVLLSGLFAGCIDPQVASDDVGSGPAAWAGETAAELAYWTARIDEADAYARKRCQEMAPLEHAERPFLRSRLGSVTAHCRMDGPSSRAAADAMDTNEVEQLAERANATTSRLLSAVSFQALPNVSSLQFAAIMAMSTVGLMNSQQEARNALEAENASHYDRQQAIIDLLRVARTSEVLEHFVTGSFRDEGSCVAAHAPASDQITTQIKRLQREMPTIQPSGGRFVDLWWPGAPMEYLNRTFEDVAAADAHGFWFVHYGEATDVSFMSALSKAVEAVPEPERSEAMRLHDENRNMTRTIWMDRWLFAAEHLEDDEVWEANPHAHWSALAYRQTHWAFAAAPCAAT